MLVALSTRVSTPAVSSLTARRALATSGSAASGAFDRHLKRSQRDRAALGTPDSGFRLHAYAAHRVAERLRDVRRTEFENVVFVPCGSGMSATAVLAEIEAPGSVALVDISPEMVRRAAGAVGAVVGGGRRGRG